MNGKLLKKRRNKKPFFPKVEDRLKIRINKTPKFTTITTGHGNINLYLYKCKIIDNPQCQCKNGDQTVEHIIFECTISDHEKYKPKAVLMWTENWPVSFNKLRGWIQNFPDWCRHLHSICVSAKHT